MSETGGRDFSVIICSYSEERWSDLRSAVVSICQQRSAEGQIVLVADHNPGLLQRMRAEFGDCALVIGNRFDRGLSGARNSGIEASQGSLVAFLDDDAIADRDWLAQLSLAFEDRSVMGVGGAIEPLWLERPPRWLPQEFLWVVGCSYGGLPVKPGPVRNLLGCNMSFRREIFETLGGFRSQLGRIGKTPLGCEETELCIRARSRWPRGIFVYQPTAKVHHRIASARGTYRYFRLRCYSEGLSKALVSRLVGVGPGLATERAYAMRTLPKAVGGSLLNAFRRRDFAAMGQAGVVALGLGFTTAGYIRGRVGDLLERTTLRSAL